MAGSKLVSDTQLGTKTELKGCSNVQWVEDEVKVYEMSVYLSHMRKNVPEELSTLLEDEDEV